MAEYTPVVRKQNGKDYIFCDWRKKYVRLTPEEWVRQQVLHNLLHQKQYPSTLIALEYAIKVGRVNKRCDAVIFSRELVPLCIIEFKAPSVAITQKTFDQIAVYNRRLNVRFLCLSNGLQTIFCSVDEHQLTFLPSIPTYQELHGTNPNIE